MSDFISRQAAIEALDFEIVHMTGFSNDEKNITNPFAQYNKGLENGIKAIRSLPSAETEQRWIPVTERLPKEEKKSYWICTDTKHQCECRWTNNIYGISESNEWNWSIFDIPQYTRVVAWMPLPEPYRGE